MTNIKLIKVISFSKEKGFYCRYTKTTEGNIQTLTGIKHYIKYCLN